MFEEHLGQKGFGKGQLALDGALRRREHLGNLLIAETDKESQMYHLAALRVVLTQFCKGFVHLDQLRIVAIIGALDAIHGIRVGLGRLHLSQTREKRCFACGGDVASNTSATRRPRSSFHAVSI